MFFGGTGDPRFSCSMLILRSRFRASRAFAKKCYPSPTGEALRVPDVAPRRPGLECPPKPAGGAPCDLFPFCYTRSAKPVPASEKTLRHAKDASGAHRIRRRRGICGQKGVDPVLPAPGISLLLTSAFFMDRCIADNVGPVRHIPEDPLCCGWERRESRVVLSVVVSRSRSGNGPWRWPHGAEAYPHAPDDLCPRRLLRRAVPCCLGPGASRDA